jgi:hypothetical protein
MFAGNSRNLITNFAGNLANDIAKYSMAIWQILSLNIQWQFGN